MNFIQSKDLGEGLQRIARSRHVRQQMNSCGRNMPVRTCSGKPDPKHEGHPHIIYNIMHEQDGSFFQQDENTMKSM
jgi:hypothetical protein